jgi:tetratricopeptide (TPR) repeat protein
MFKVLLSVAVLCTAAVARGEEYKEYGTYDLSAAFERIEAANGDTRHKVDVKLIDQVVSDLAAHAKDYPPKFRTEEEKSRAVKDSTVLIELFDILAADKDAHSALLRKAAFVDSIGHNLDIPGAADKAVQTYERVLELEPDNARANLSYGIFLAGTGTRQKDSLQYLNKALELGLEDARYTLGLVHLAVGDNDKAVEYLEAYAKTRPEDNRTGKLLAAIKSGNVKFSKGQ